MNRTDPPSAAGEYEILVGFLDFLRGTIALKTDDLDATGLAQPLAPSTMTLGGLLKHLAFVENYWLVYRFDRQDPGEPWESADWSADPDWEWNSAAADSPEQLRALWRGAVETSRAIVAPDRIDELCRPGGDGSQQSLRWILVHLIEEYARHCGHADLLREAIDGSTGE